MQPFIYIPNQPPLVDGNQQLINGGQLQQSHQLMIPHYSPLLAPQFQQSQNIIYHNQMIPYQQHNSMHVSMSHIQPQPISSKHQFADSSSGQQFIYSSGFSQIQPLGSNEPSPINSIVNKDAQQCFSNLVNPADQPQRSKNGQTSSDSVKSSPQPVHNSKVCGKLKADDAKLYEFKSEKSDPLKSLRSLKGMNYEKMEQNAINSEYMRSDHKPPSNLQIEEEQKQPISNSKSSKFIASIESDNALLKHNSLPQSQGTPIFQPLQNEDHINLANGANQFVNNQSINFENAHKNQVIMNQQNINQLASVLNNKNQGQVIQENHSRGQINHPHRSIIKNSPQLPIANSEEDYCLDTNEDAIASGVIHQEMNERYLQNAILSNLSSKDKKGCLIGNYRNFKKDDMVQKLYIETYNHHLYQDLNGGQVIRNINAQQEELKRFNDKTMQEKVQNQKKIVSMIQKADQAIDRVELQKQTFLNDLKKKLSDVQQAQLDIGPSIRQNNSHSIGLGAVRRGSALISNSLISNSLSCQLNEQDQSQNQVNSSINQPVALINQRRLSNSLNFQSSPQQINGEEYKRVFESGSPNKKIDQAMIQNYNQLNQDLQHAQLEQIAQVNINQINKLIKIQNGVLNPIEEQKVSNEYSQSNERAPSNRNNYSAQRIAEDGNEAIIEQDGEESKIEIPKNEISESESRRFLDSPKSGSNAISPKIIVNGSIRSNTRSQNINLLQRNNESRFDRSSLIASLGHSQMSGSREQSIENYGLDIQYQMNINESQSQNAVSSNSSDNSCNSSFFQAPSSLAQSSNWSKDDSPRCREKKLKSQFYPMDPQIIEASREEESKNEQSINSQSNASNHGNTGDQQLYEKVIKRQKQKQLMQIQQLSSGGSQKFNQPVTRRVVGKGQKASSDGLENKNLEIDSSAAIQPPLLKKISSRKRKKLAKIQAKNEKRMKRHKKKMKHLFKYCLISKAQKNIAQQLSQSVDEIVFNNMSSPSQQNIEIEHEQKAKQQEELLNEIVKTVQQGGDNVLQRFNSFGESDQEGSSYEHNDRPPRRIAESGNAAYFQNLVENGYDVTKRKSSSSIGLTTFVNEQANLNHEEEQSLQPKFISISRRKSRSCSGFGRLVQQEDKQPQECQESSLIVPLSLSEEKKEEVKKKEPEKMHKHESFSQTVKNEEKKKNNESPVTHSIIVRQIIELLETLMVPFNEGRIIQMTLIEKQNLKESIEKFIQLRNEEQKIDFQQSQRHKAFSFNTLDNAEIQKKNQEGDQTRKRKQSRRRSKHNPDIMIQQMRSNYYMDRSIQSKQRTNIFQSNNKDFASNNNDGRGKLEAIEKDYDFYFRHKHNFFVVQSQIRHQQLIRLKKSINLAEHMHSMQQFEETKQELFQEDINLNQKTLCFDIVDVFVKLMDINDIEQFNQLREASDTNFHEYILINKTKTKYHDCSENSPTMPVDQIYRAQKYLERNKSQLLQIIHNYDEIKFEDRGPMQQSVGSTSPPDRDSKAPCCQLNALGKLCLCNKFLFHVRPYTFEFLRALQPFFEIVATSNISYYLLEQIIDHMEFVLNKPITDMIIKQAESRNLRQQEENGNQQDNSPRSENDFSPGTNQRRYISKKEKKRRQKKIEPKIFFQLLISNINYYKIESLDQDNKSINESLENLFILTQNRKPENIFLISSNQFKLVAAMDLGFCAIPIIKYHMDYMVDDYQLNLLENYLHKLKYSKDIKYKNQKDFGYLSQIMYQNKKQDSRGSRESRGPNSSNHRERSNIAALSGNNSHNLSNTDMMQICSQNISFGDGNLSGLSQYSINSRSSRDDSSSNQLDIGRIVESKGSKKLNKQIQEQNNVMKSSLIDSDDEKSSSSLSSSEEEKSDEEEKFQDLQSSNEKGVFDNIINEIEQRDQSKQIIKSQLKSLTDKFVVINPVKEEIDESSSSNNKKKNSNLSVVDPSQHYSGCFGEKGIYSQSPSSSLKHSNQSPSNQSCGNNKSQSLPEFQQNKKSQSKSSLEKVMGNNLFKNSEKQIKKQL